jgi:hypothetical protein
VPIYLKEECSIQKGEKSWQMRGEEGRRQVGQAQHQSPQVARLIPATENKFKSYYILPNVQTFLITMQGTGTAMHK